MKKTIDEEFTELNERLARIMDGKGYDTDKVIDLDRYRILKQIDKKEERKTPTLDLEENPFKESIKRAKALNEKLRKDRQRHNEKLLKQIRKLRT